VLFDDLVPFELVRRCNRMSRIAAAWISESSSWRIKACLAASDPEPADQSDDQIELIDRLRRPSRMCAFSSARARSYLVRR